jgi:hypothetical protein
MTVDYAFIDVAGRAHLLPVRAEAEMSRSHAVTRNVVSLAGYRKFSADAIIDFHDPPPAAMPPKEARRAFEKAAWLPPQGARARNSI